MAQFELWLTVLINAVLSLLEQPFFYISLILLVILLRYRVKMERKMFSVKLQRSFPIWLKSILLGIGTAILVSVIAALLGLTITKETLILLWVIQIILIMFKFRLVSIAYSAAIIILLHEALSLISPLSLAEPYATIYDTVMSVSTFSLAMLTAIIIFVQGIMLKIQGKHFVSPINIEGKRGKIVGGYVLQAYWSLPLFIFMPVSSTESGAIIFDTAVSTPLFLELGPEAWALMAFPVIVGNSVMSKTMTPKQLIAKISNSLLCVSLFVMVLIAAVWWIPGLIWVVPIALLLTYSFPKSVISAYEAKHAPIYTEEQEGLRILALVSRTTSEQIGLHIGELIRKVNGQPVRNISELYDAISLNPAYCKLEVLDESGELKFAQRTRYADEHHQLGIILAPNQNSPYMEKFYFPSIFGMLEPKGVKRQGPALQQPNLLQSNDMSG